MLHMDNQQNFESLRVASFSAYLNSSEENSVLKVTKAIKDHSLDIDPGEVTPYRANSGKIKAGHEGEIGVFGADKYFNMGTEQETPKLIDLNKMNKVEVDTKQSKTGAPSVFSEASSNSQGLLLPKLLKSPSTLKQRNGNGRRFFKSLGCSGLCSNKKSIRVDDGVESDCLVHKNDQLRKESFRFANTVEPDGARDCQTGLKGGDNFEFSVPKSREENLVTKNRIEVEEPRHSIEVFGSSMKRMGDQVIRNLERKLSILTWDAIPRTQNQALTIGSGPFDDNQSDASSDLFEIESLSGNRNTFLTKQGSEKNSYCASPTTQYAPSEASIEWSIVTASAADFSFASEYDQKSVSRDLIQKTSKLKNTEQKRPGGLLGCTSQKAVSVAEIAHKSTDKAKFVGEGKPQGRVKDDYEFAPIC